MSHKKQSKYVIQLNLHQTFFNCTKPNRSEEETRLEVMKWKVFQRQTKILLILLQTTFPSPFFFPQLSKIPILSETYPYSGRRILCFPGRERQPQIRRIWFLFQPLHTWMQNGPLHAGGHEEWYLSEPRNVQKGRRNSEDPKNFPVNRCCVGLSIQGLLHRIQFQLFSFCCVPLCHTLNGALPCFKWGHAIGHQQIW